MSPDLHHFKETSIDTGLLITALDTVSEGLMICDLNYRILYKNVASTYVLDSTESFNKNDFVEWQSKFKIFDLKTHTEISHSDLPIVRAVSGLKFSDYLIQVISKETMEDYILSCNGTPLIGKNHTIVGAVITFRDITKGYLAERRIKEEKAFYKNILDWIPAEIFVYDNEKEFYFKNHKFENHLKGMLKKGWTPSEASKEMIKRNDDQVLKKLQALEFDEQIEFPDGVKMYHTIRFPLYHQSSHKVLICAIAFDVTDKVAMEKNVENERVNSINASKLAAIGALAGEIGHEINNPITIMRSITFMIREMMMDKKLTSSILKDKLDTMDSTLNRIQKIVVSLKNLSRKSSNEKKEACPLRNIIQDVVALSEMKFNKFGVELIYDAKDPTLQTSVDCFQIQFSQVIVNLLSNAVDAVTEGKKRQVEMKFSEDQEFVFIKVCDTGQGIPENIRQKIFEPFFTTKKVGEGTGLGLSISKNIMEAHGGSIDVESSSYGTCFTIKLPK